MDFSRINLKIEFFGYSCWDRPKVVVTQNISSVSVSVFQKFNFKVELNVFYDFFIYPLLLVLDREREEVMGQILINYMGKGPFIKNVYFFVIFAPFFPIHYENKNVFRWLLRSVAPLRAVQSTVLTTKVCFSLERTWENRLTQKITKNRLYHKPKRL